MRILTEITLTFFLNAAWQVLLIGAFACVCAWLLRGTTVRCLHAVWVAALILSVIVPAATVVSRLGRTASEPVPPLAITVQPFVPPAVESPEFAPGVVQPPPENSAQKPANRFSAPIHVNQRTGIAIAFFYLLFLLYQSAKLFRAWLRTRDLVRQAFVFEPPGPLASVLERCHKRANMRNVRLLASGSVGVPITAGVFKPVIILPEQLLDETDENLLTSALGHELVHVARRDYLLNLLYELIYVPVSFHPMAAGIRRRVKQTRELCCDERVTEDLLNAQTYAQSLVRLIGAAPVDERLAANTTIGITGSDNLEVRIMTLLKARRVPNRRKSLLLIAAALLLAVPCVAAARLALSFDLTGPGFAAAGNDDYLSQDPDAAGTREQLKRTAQELREQIRVAQESQRPELQQKLKEVETALTEHERLLQQYQQQKDEGSEQKTRALREALEQLQRQQPPDEARINEVRQQLLQVQRLTSEVNLRAAETRLAQLERQRSTLSQTQLEELRRSQRQVEFLKEQQEQLQKQEQETKGQEQGQVFAMRRYQERTQRDEEERARRQVELTRDATIPMDRAIQIATSQVPGKVLACSLGRDGDKLFYHVIIVTTEGDQSTTTYVWVSATDGQILKTEKERRGSVSGGKLNRRAIRLPEPEYPAIARAAHASGEVTVEITVDEEGNVIAARAVAGHPLLQAAAVSAARQAKFEPAKLEGQPTKVSGLLSYVFQQQ